MGVSSICGFVLETRKGVDSSSGRKSAKSSSSSSSGSWARVSCCCTSCSMLGCRGLLLNFAIASTDDSMAGVPCSCGPSPDGNFKALVIAGVAFPLVGGLASSVGIVDCDESTGTWPPPCAARAASLRFFSASIALAWSASLAILDNAALSRPVGGLGRPSPNSFGSSAPLIIYSCLSRPPVAKVALVLITKPSLSSLPFVRAEDLGEGVSCVEVAAAFKTRAVGAEGAIFERFGRGILYGSLIILPT